MKILKKIWKYWAALSGILCLFFITVIGYGIIKSEIKQKKFRRANLAPILNFIEGHKTKELELPSSILVEDFAKSEGIDFSIKYHISDPELTSHFGIIGEDYILGVWRGEWYEYYSSHNNKYFTEY